MVPPIPTAGPTQTPSSMTLLPPTTNLPPIKSLLSPSSSHSLTVQTLSENLDYLRKIYNPSVRGSKRRRTVPSSSLHSSSSAGIASTNTTFSLDSFRSDTFERAYAIRWLGALIKAIDSGRLEDVLSTSITDNLVGKDTNIDLNLDSLLHSASALLAVCSGTSAAGRIVREYEFEVEVDITKTIAKRSMHVSLTDIPLSNSNGDSNSNTNTNSSDSNQTSSSSGILVDAAPFASSLQLSPLSGSSPITSTSNHHHITL
ncbi:hypothetical protein D9758_010950 [Tetrapyrgos nigripes]|uniref:Uncharacterized protein n=1 Tax=Tetrapyrgos nigripes TaxID=182062 RepID=A0A8H5CUT8_9AGAR|nr:hypothetical protein D9758_010950 [Tetrapyrgos nigripes]